MAIGNRVFLQRDLPNLSLLDQFRQLPAANVADCMGRLCALSSEIRRMNLSCAPMCGVALTVRGRPGDNMMLHQAMNMAGPNDVIVFSNQSDRTHSIMGEIMYRYMADFKKVAGIVIDGPIRDIDAISQGNCPIYATGTTPGGPYKEGPGEINVPIAIGNIAIEPGDIILGDADGVIVIPKLDAAAILPVAQANAANDSAKVLKSSTGTGDRSWVDRLMAQKEVEFIDAAYHVYRQCE